MAYTYSTHTLLNMFLEIWFQSLETWIVYLYKLPNAEERSSFRDETLAVIRRFIDSLEEINLQLDNDIMEETKEGYAI